MDGPSYVGELPTNTPLMLGLLPGARTYGVSRPAKLLSIVQRWSVFAPWIAMTPEGDMLGLVPGAITRVV